MYNQHEPRIILSLKNEITIEDREIRNNHKSAVVWLTGLSGAGKSTISIETEGKLFFSGKHVFILDGDNLRLGLNKDLGFSKENRRENIRRAAEVANLFYKAGYIVFCSFISPFQSDRDFARSLIPQNRFFEVFIKCSIEECIRRDPKKLYEKALNKDIPDFTGISSPYEEPSNAELIIDSERLSPKDSALAIISMLQTNKII